MLSLSINAKISPLASFAAAALPASPVLSSFETILLTSKRCAIAVVASFEPASAIIISRLPAG